MKKLLTLVAGVIVVNLSAFAQGSILFQNVGPGLNAGIRDTGLTLIPAGSSQFMVELLAGTSATSVAPLFPAVTTTTWVGNGWFGVGSPEKVLTGFAPGSLPFFAVRVWDSTGGLTYDQAVAAGREYIDSRYSVDAGGAGGVFQLAAAGGLGDPNASPPVPGPALIGMQGLHFLWIPEPSPMLLGVLGVVAFLLRRRMSATSGKAGGL